MRPHARESQSAKPNWTLATRAWQTARKGAALLKEQFGAREVFIFGSILIRGHFHQHSDIDFAAWEIPESDYLRAVGAVLDLDPEFSADLVRMEEARDSLRICIEQDGQPL